MKDHRIIEENGRPIMHRTWFKLLLNPLLRRIQFWTSRPYVIASHIENGRVVRYSVCRRKLCRQ